MAKAKKTTQAEQDRKYRKAAARAATLSAAGPKGWAMPSQVVPDRRKAANRSACRGRVVDD